MSMGREDGRLTLQGLAQRLEALERENAELRHEKTVLRGSGTHRDEGAHLRDPESHRAEDPASEAGEQVSRRWLLGKAGAAAVAAVAAGTLLGTREAKAHHFDSGIRVNFVGTHFVFVEAQNPGDRAVEAFNTASQEGAVHARNSGDGPGVRGLGGTGVWGSSATLGHSGVYGQHTGTGFGVVGDGKGTGSAGVLGRNSSAGFQAFGVKGETQDGVGVKGIGKNGVVGESPKLDHAAVYGKHTGSSGYGVVGDGKGGTGAGVLGRNSSGTGVWGEGKTGVVGRSSTQSGVSGQHTGNGGTGVEGVGRGASSAGVAGVNYDGYGGSFFGGKAPLALAPGITTGKPTTGAHRAGEIFLDSAATLFVCTESGTPGTWRRVQTAAT